MLSRYGAVKLDPLAPPASVGAMRALHMQLLQASAYGSFTFTPPAFHIANLRAHLRPRNASIAFVWPRASPTRPTTAWSASLVAMVSVSRPMKKRGVNWKLAPVGGGGQVSYLWRHKSGFEATEYT